MKRILFFLLSFLSFTYISSQTNEEVKAASLALVDIFQEKYWDDKEGGLLDPLPMKTDSHMNFMNIPISGDINSFQSKLSAKGFKVCESVNKLIPNGIRLFNGQFTGEDSYLAVYYNPQNKIVYKVRVITDFSSDVFCKNKYLNNIESLKSKHSSAEYSEGKINGNPISLFKIKASNNTLTKGKIFLFCITNSLMIEYVDNDNYIAHYKKQMESF